MARADARWRWMVFALGWLLAGCVGSPLVITPPELEDGVEGQTYQATLSCDGTEPLTWRVTDGTLPTGLLLNRSTGMLAGIPAAAGSYTFTVSVEDGSFPSRRGEQIYTLRVISALQLSAAFEPARVDEYYSATVTATGGTPPYTFSQVGLPAGLAFDEQTGTVSGTPVRADPGLRVDITVTDSGTPPLEVTESFTLVIKPKAVEILTDTLPDGTVGQTYEKAGGAAVQVVAINGQQPYSWAVVAGVLPDGLRLDTHTGVISGTPTAAGTWTFTIQVTDADDPASSDSAQYTVTVTE